MKVKTITSLLSMTVLSFMVSTAFAAEVMNKVHLDKVTLFFKGAELQGSSAVAVPKGESEIILTQLANNINANSINVSIGDKAMILSTTLVDNYLIKKDESPQLKTLKNELEKLENQYQNVNIKLVVVNEEIALLKNNRIDSINQAKNSLKDATLTINFIKDNLVNALTEKNDLEKSLAKLNEEITKQKRQIDLENGGSDSRVKALKVKLYSPEPLTLPVTLSYLTPDAGWMPTYDVRVKDINSPVQLIYKANIYQNSGLVWDNIDFTLSTANPSEGITALELQPWNIDLQNSQKGGAYANGRTGANFYLKDVAPQYEYAADGKARNSFTDYVVTNNNGLNEQFKITLPYSIMTYSNDNILTLKEKMVTAEYRYIATPKLDNNAFLQAQISDWDTLSLLPGKSTVFYADNYIGEGYITTQGIKDKLNISLGRDKEIIIERNQDLNEKSKPSFFGSDISQKFAYTIDMKNTKVLPIDITIYDQIPVIQNKTISLDEVKYQGADYNKETGLLTWHVTLQAKELKKLPFSFKLTYPQKEAENIIGL